VAKKSWWAQDLAAFTGEGANGLFAPADLASTAGEVDVHIPELPVRIRRR
jgi:hypothetical protein